MHGFAIVEKGHCVFVGLRCCTYSMGWFVPSCMSLWYWDRPYTNWFNNACAYIQASLTSLHAEWSLPAHYVSDKHWYISIFSIIVKILEPIYTDNYNTMLLCNSYWSVSVSSSQSMRLDHLLAHQLPLATLGHLLGSHPPLAPLVALLALLVVLVMRPTLVSKLVCTL